MMLQITVDTTQTLKDFTDAYYAQASFCFRALLKDREIKVNGKKVGDNVLLHEGDAVQYYLTKKQADKPAFYNVYEDENVLVIDKESGVNAEAVFHALERKYGENCRFIHRLDRNTKGLMIFALHARAETALLEAFRTRDVHKTYLALCVGEFSKPQAILTAYLKKDEEKSLVKVYDQQIAGAETIITEYKVLERREELTKVEITLHTGKTHQIRAHLAHIGNPVLGDMKYGDEQANKQYQATRQCLVAKRLTFALSGELDYLNDKTFVSRFEV